MMKSELQTVTSEQVTQLQRQYLNAKFNGIDPLITDKSLERDGRRRNKVVNEAVKAGLLIPTNEKTWNGMSYRISADVVASVIPVAFGMFELWRTLQEKNPHREAFERPWIRVEDQACDVQCALLTMEGIDWFVVSITPYEFHGSFAKVPESAVSESSRPDSYHGYWAGPFSTLDEAINRRRAISGVSVAASSIGLRQQVREFFAERRFQKAFANNLLWGLVDVGHVPRDLVYGSDGKPTLDSQLEEGHSFRFESNPNCPTDRGTVSWQENLVKSIERLKSRIENAEQQLEKLRFVDARIQSCGGWDSFMDAMEQRLRAELAEKSVTEELP